MQGRDQRFDRIRRFGADQLRRQVLRGLVADAGDARLAVFDDRIEHAAQRADRRGRNAAHEDLPERNPVK